MSNFVYENRNTLFKSPDANWLELGAGTGLPSIIASKYCQLNEVLLSDKFDENSRLLEMVTKSTEHNKCSIRCLNLNWSQLDVENLQKLPKIDFIIGSDVFFSSKLFEGIKREFSIF